MTKAVFALFLTTAFAAEASMLAGGIGPSTSSGDDVVITSGAVAMVAESDVACALIFPRTVISPFILMANSGINCLLNGSPSDWTTLDIKAPFPGGQASDFPCGGNLFINCSVTVSPDQAVLDILFTGTGGNFPGIPSGSKFKIDLGTSGWVSGEPITVFANVPEPSPGIMAGCLLFLGWAVKLFRSRGVYRELDGRLKRLEGV